MEKSMEKLKENENKNSRKDWIKNITIIFLVIMLLLTFFSNTIMNYSLPEVATGMVEPGTITAKIRGTGTLSSEDPYKITIQESRTIASVAVKAGDQVEKDQVLFYLEDKESTELETAQKELNELILDYSTTILKGDITDESFDRIQAGVLSTNQEYQDRITVAKQVVESCQATLDSIDRQIAIAEGAILEETTDYKSALDNATMEYEKAQQNLTAKKEELAIVQAEGKGDAVALTKERHEAEELVKEKLVMLEGSDGLGGLRKELEAAMNTILSLLSPAESIIVKSPGEIQNINTYMGKLSDLYERAKNVTSSPEMNHSANLAVAAEKMEAFRKTFEEYKAAKMNLKNAKERLNKVVNAGSNLAAVQAAINEAQNQADEWLAKKNAIENAMESEASNATQKKQEQEAALEQAKDKAQADLDKAKKELDQLLIDVSSELNLGNQNSIIREKREEIEKLKEKATGAVIKAPVAGIVTAVNKTAGETTQPEEELAIMQPEGKGYSMSFSVTGDQAKKVKVGDKAEIQNSWFYSDIEATLTGIKPDPENPSQKKLLVFDVKGEVQAGQSVSLSIGQKSADYDMLVPNSAIREDNRGKFILIVESKSSPLGNRYMATRVDVEVLGADDLKTAINAPLQGYEYVITTATRPVEAGKQVRLAESD